MTADEQLDLRRMAEGFRARCGQIEGKHGKTVWVQTINVMEAFQQCAEELEQFVATPKCPAPEPTTNPS